MIDPDLNGSLLVCRNVTGSPGRESPIAHCRLVPSALYPLTPSTATLCSLRCMPAIDIIAVVCVNELDALCGWSVRVRVRRGRPTMEQCSPWGTLLAALAAFSERIEFVECKSLLLEEAFQRSLGEIEVLR